MLPRVLATVRCWWPSPTEGSLGRGRGQGRRAAGGGGDQERGVHERHWREWGSQIRDWSATPA
eukprot:4426632-Alexandrium_andersonii.AAC.1